MREAYLFIAAVGFLLSSSLTFPQDGFFCRLVPHGLRNASRTALLGHSTQHDDSSSPNRSFGMTFNGRLTLAASPR